MRASHAYYDDDIHIDYSYTLPFVYPPPRPCECSADVPVCGHCKAWKREHPYVETYGEVGSPQHPASPRRATPKPRPSARREDTRTTGDLWAREDHLLARLHEALTRRNALPVNDRRAIGAQEEVRSIRQMLRNVRQRPNYVPRPEVLARFEEPSEEGRPLPSHCPKGHAMVEGAYRLRRTHRNTSRGHIVRCSRQCLECQRKRKEQYVNA